MTQAFNFEVSEKTRVKRAIDAGAKPVRIGGVMSVMAPAERPQAHGQCQGLPYAIDYVSSKGAAVHVWVGAQMDEARFSQVVHALKYWTDVFEITWSTGEPSSYQTCYNLTLPTAA